MICTVPLSRCLYGLFPFPQNDPPPRTHTAGDGDHLNKKVTAAGHTPRKHNPVPHWDVWGRRRRADGRGLVAPDTLAAWPSPPSPTAHGSCGSTEVMS